MGAAVDGINIAFAPARDIQNFLFENVDIRPGAAVGANGVNFTISVNTVEDTALKDLVIRDLGGNGIVFNNAADTERLEISGGEIIGNGGDGIQINSGGDLTDSTIRGVRIESNGVNGVNITSSVNDIDPFNFTGNTVTGNANDGLYIENTGDIDDLNILDNFFDENGDENIEIVNAGEGERWTFSGNTINRAADEGAFLHPTGELTTVVFTGNQFVNNTENNLRIENGDDIRDLTFEGNDFLESINRNGVNISPTGDVDDVYFTGNRALDNDQFGIKIDPGAGSDVTNVRFEGDNDISRNGMSGVLIDTDGGDVRNIFVQGNTFYRNGGLPPTPPPVLRTHGFHISSVVLPVLLIDGVQYEADGVGDVINVEFMENDIFENFDDGVNIHGDNVRDILFKDNAGIHDNGDHGVFIEAADTLAEVTVENNEITGSDNDGDEVGTNLYLSGVEDVNTIVVKGNTLNAGFRGVRVRGQDNIIDVTIDGNTANDNVQEGIDIDGQQNISGVDITNNELLRNGIGIRVRVLPTEISSDILIKGNKIVGGSGTGILMDAKNITVTENAVRKNDVGIEVLQAQGNSVTKNNIARNELFGLRVAPGITDFPAMENWWGEPSGPKHPLNPNGIGDKVSDGVNFIPFLDEPVCTVDLICPKFEFIIQSFTGPEEAGVTEPVQYVASIKNIGTEEGTQDITLTVTKVGSEVPIAVKSVTKTINPQATTEVTFDYEFPAAGDYEVCVETQDDKKCIDVTVTGPPTLAIEQAVAQHTGDPTIIEDPDIIWAIELWIASTPVPGTPNLVIDDDKVLELVELWIAGTPVPAVSGAAAEEPKPKKKGFNLFEWLFGFFGFFAGRPTAASPVMIDHQASPMRVAPGGSFTVTVQVGGEAGGLLLAAELPAGWTVRPLDNGGAFYKPSEHKWLWLGLGAPMMTLTYEVHVPADATPGIYTITGSYKAAGGAAGELPPLRIEVLGEPVALKVDAIKFTGSRFIVEGQGIAEIEAQVWDLTGKLIFSGAASGNVLSVASLATSGSPLANGVYLYTVAVKGTGGETFKSKVHKLVVVR